MWLLSLGYWKYVFDDSRADREYGPWNPTFYRWTYNDEFITNPFAKLGNYLSRCWCRLRNHPAGVNWYNPGGFEPDMYCRGCGEDLG